MAKATLQIQLENAAVKAGMPVRGEVVVQAQADAHCNGVIVRKRWYAHGRGNGAWGTWVETKIVPGADWTAGMEYRYPFSLPTDAAPVSYHGTYLNVDWVLQASADLPWALDPSTETQFLVTVGDAPASWNVAAPPPGSKGQSGIGGAIALTLFGTVFGGVGVMTALSGSFAGWIFFGLGALAVFGGAIGPIRRKMAEHAIGHPEVRVDPSSPRPGQIVVTTFRSRPPGPVTVGGAVVRLVANERVVSGSGKHTTTHTIDHEMGRIDIAGTQISTSPMIELEMPITLPADAPPSFKAQENDLRWVARVTITIPGEPNWEEDFPLLVQ